MSTLDEKLQPWTSDRINDYVRLLYGRSTWQRKQDRIDAVCRYLLEPATLADVWGRLDELSRRAVSTAFHNGGEWDESAFIAHYGARPTAPADEKSIFSFYWRPILFDLFVFDGEIPDDLLPHLEALVLPRDPFQPEGLDELPAEHQTWHGLEPLTQAWTEQTGRADLLAYLHLVEQQGLSWSRSNDQLTGTSLRKLYAHLSAADYYDEPAKMSVSQVIRPVGLDQFARSAGLVTSYGVLTPAGRQFLQTQDPELFLTAFEEWTTSNHFDELTRITQLRGLKGRATRLTKPGSRREKIIEALSWCPTGVWIRCQEFFRAVKIWQFDFEVEQGDWSNLYVGSYRDYGEMMGETYWQVVKGLYIKAILMEQLATIGAVDIAYVDGEYGEWPNDLFVDGPLSPYDGLLYFRINSWGAFLFGQGEAYAPANTSDALFTIDDRR
ncbi:MAG: hypothetical protein KDE28_10745, partial [Anaerolineales bacterium]|nr:hypothetical protein [Anaerolineales bacterium]